MAKLHFTCANPSIQAVLSEYIKQSQHVALDSSEEADALVREQEGGLGLVLQSGGERTFLAAPFHFSELETALAGILARLKIHLGGGWVLEAGARELKGPTTLRLTEKETEVLVRLHAATTPLSRETLLAEVWGYHPESDTHTVETHLYRLRKKLESAGGPQILSTSEGYSLK